MSDTGNAEEAPGVDSRYFFLSYAHSAPIEGYPDENPDEWVSKFFADLAAAVEQHPARRSRLKPGFFDQKIPVDSNWKESLRQALSIAEVFVPLFSPRYLASSWPGREWACFEQRMAQAGLPDPGRRFVPVLWTPLPEARDLPGLETLYLGPGTPNYVEDYAENGLRALLKIEPFRDSYEAVVSQVAERIVMVTEESVLEPSPVPDIDKVQSAFLPKRPLAIFTVEVAAPTSRARPASHAPDRYGERSTDWRPFAEQELPLAEYARQVAERFDFEVRISSIKSQADKPEQTDDASTRRPAKRKPGIMLIDPWLVADRNGKRALESAVERLPRWVLPLVVSSQPDDERTAELTEQVRTMLNAAGARPTELSRRAVRSAGSLDAFVTTVRELVAEAERQYLRYSSGPPGPGRSKRPRLGGGGWPITPTSGGTRDE